MNIKSLSKKLLWLLGMILIGALGSGLWEGFLKQSLMWVGTFILDIATLGLNSLRDGMYLDAAKGTYERTAISFYSMNTGNIIGITISVIVIALYLKKKEIRKNQGESKSVEEISIWILATLLLACCLIIIIQTFRVSYIARAANHVDQMINIVSPYVSQSEILKYKSRFAQIETRKDYFVLVEDLHKIAKENSTKVPKFDIY